MSPQFGWPGTSGLVVPSLPADGDTVFDLDPDDVTAAGGHSRVTVVGGAATAITDAAGGSIVLAAGSNGGPAWSTAAADVINGHAVLKTTTAGEQLWTTTAGPVWGDGPWTLYAVMASPSMGAGNYPGGPIVGQADGVQHHVATMGTYNTSYFAVVYDGTTDAISGNATADVNPHVFCATYDGAGNLAIYVGDVLQAKGTVTGTPALLQGFGLGPWYPSFKYAMRYARALWRTGVDSVATRQQIARALAIKYGLCLPDQVTCIGDSLTYGLGAGTPATGSYPARLAAALASSWAPSVLAAGTTGYTTANIITAIAAASPWDALSPASGAKRNNLAAIYAFTNDIANGVAPAVTIANLQSILATVKAAGYLPVLCTGFPFVNGNPGTWVQASADTINAWIRQALPAKQIVDLALMPQMAIVGGAYQSNWRNTVTNIGHPNDAGYAAMAAVAAPVLWGLRQ